MSFLNQLSNKNSNADKTLFFNGLWVSATAFFCLVVGSAATAIFFLGATIVAWHLLRKPKSCTLPRSHVWWSLFFVFIWCVILFTSALKATRVSDYEFVLSNLQLLVLPLTLIGLRQTPSFDYHTLLSRSFSIALPLALLIGIIQRLFFWMLPQGGLGNATVYATVCSIAGLICLANYKTETKRWKLLALSGYICALAIAFLVIAKTAIIILLCGTLFLISAAVHQGILTKTRSFMVLIALCLAVGSSLYITGHRGNLLEQRIFANIETLNTDGISFKSVLGETRFNMFSYSLKVIAQNPLLGVGPQNRNLAVSELAKEDGVEIRSATHLHNEYLNHFVGSGIIGLLGYIALLLAPLLITLKSINRQDISARLYTSACLSGGFAIAGITNVHLGQDILVTFFVFICVVLLVQSQQPMHPD